MTHVHLPGVRELISEEQIRARVSALAARIDEDYADAEEILLLGVLRGSYIFIADLSRALSIERRVDFIALSSYDRDEQRAGVRLIMDARVPIEGRHVLVVEDILDTGGTLSYLLDLLAARRPASLRSCVLVRKPEQKKRVSADYIGFDIPDEWVVGYGLDYDNRFRALPFIGTVNPDALD
ncbi:MAG: hypoxanthine phosphoribosyltransferase [Gemmatimonadota bacterium]